MFIGCISLYIYILLYYFTYVVEMSPCHPMSPDFQSIPSMSLRGETFENG